MFGDLEFFGSTTVGERGQIVLPAKLRKKHSIGSGDKLLVLSMPGPMHGIMLLKAEALNEMLTTMGKHIEFFKEQVNGKPGRKG
ncbi:MAG: AbrB/MazE/SpoVT family DNA-binding domain-containing protein [Euryarchaeota archaeon]|nr:AbrB/MazE/SpoVT family DNA-binding domain-containing protein [Euryarchaeota archaeon]